MSFNKGKKGRDENGRWRLSSSVITIYNAIFGALMILVLTVGMLLLVLSSMTHVVDTSMQGAMAQSSGRLRETLLLLKTLADMPEFSEPVNDAQERAKRLDEIRERYNYFLLCYVDENMMVHSENDAPASLASRGYLQRLFATATYQITDSFPAWADGYTLNYTVAVPLLDNRSNVNGSLCAAIYFDEMDEILTRCVPLNSTRLMLLGSAGQIMSSTSGQPYGSSAVELFRECRLFGATADDIEERLLSGEGGGFWCFYRGDFYRVTYEKIPQARWNLVCSVGFRSILQKIIPGYLFMLALLLITCALHIILVKTDIAKQMKTVDMLISSVGELERRIYHEEHPEEHDFNEIIKLTSKGLTDGLTGAVTRTVFLNQAAVRLKAVDKSLVSALCFVDLDNLKYINDNFGHSGGDAALKSVGYILRECEKRFDGIVGRFGGDEFVMLMTDLDGLSELTGVLDELTLRMHSDVSFGAERIPVRCSIGVSVFCEGKTVEQLLAEADEALYFVKKNGKGYYKLHEGGRAYES